MEYYRDHYISGPEKLRNPLASPMLEENLEGLHPAFVVAVEFDVLLDEVRVYTSRPEEAGDALSSGCSRE